MSNLNVSVTQLNFYGKNLGVFHANIVILLRPIFIQNVYVHAIFVL